MQLYYATGACSLVVRITLHKLKLKFNAEQVNLKTKRTAAGIDFLAINAKGAVPTLQLNDGLILTENSVILQYLADTYQATELLPAPGTIARYRVLEWLNFASTDLHKNCVPLFNSNIPDDLKNTLFKPILSKNLRLLEKHLQANQFLIDTQLTLGDYYLFVVLLWLPKLKIDLATWPNLTRYFQSMRVLPEVQQALLDEQLA